MGALKQFETISFPRAVRVEPPAVAVRLVTVEQLAHLLGCTPNAIRMKEKRGVLRRVETRERKVLFELQESLAALGYEQTTE